MVHSSEPIKAKINKSILANFGLAFLSSDFLIKDFIIKRRFSFPVLQVNRSLPFTMLKATYTNSEFFFHLRARK